MNHIAAEITKNLGRITLVAILFISTSTTVIGQPPPPPFDFDNGNSGEEVIIPQVVPVIFQKVSPGGGDATLILRTTTIITNSWFDAIAPYHPTARGVYSNLGRRPMSQRTDRSRNIAMLYSSYRVLNSLYPREQQLWRDMLTNVGLDPDDDQENNVTPIGIGNKAGNAVAQFRERDGMNQLGNEGGCKHNCQEYADYTGYKPKNTAYKLRFPSRWQPDIVSNRYGTFTVQQFITPQFKRTKPYSYNNPNRFRAPFPSASQVQNFYLYKRQADEVIRQSAAMTDEQKMTAEFFDNKILSLGFSTLFASTINNLSLEEFVVLDFLANVAAFDTGIAIWNEKFRYDAVRPFSSIEFLYRNRKIRAWGGPGKGTVRIKASEWRSYLQTANHPEYPSASASFCAAHAEVHRRFLGTDDLGWQVPYPQGSSNVEPGVTPANDLILFFPTWTDFETRCGDSRFWSGVHFKPSVPAGQDIGSAVADKAFNFVMSHVNGIS